MFSIDSVTNSHLVNEGGKTVVETLDLILFLGSDSLDGGVNLKVEGGQQALVDSNGCDGGLRNHATSKASNTHG